MSYSVQNSCAVCAGGGRPVNESELSSQRVEIRSRLFILRNGSIPFASSGRRRKARRRQETSGEKSVTRVLSRESAFRGSPDNIEISETLLFPANKTVRGNPARGEKS